MHFGLPAENRSDVAEVRVEVADIDRFAILRIFPHRVFASAVDLDQEFGKRLQTDHLIATQIENLAVCDIVSSGKQESIDRIVNVSEVSKLRASPDFERLAFDQRADPDSEKCLA